jgi:hypothetical protein
MRVRVVGVGAVVVAFAISQAGAASPERTELIRMGKGIGKVQLGMTRPAVRRALGGPHAVVYRRVDFGARGRYLELGWERPGRSWEPVLWQVGFRSLRRRGTMRVVRVSTTAPSQRTPKRLGVGSRPRQIVRAYPHATCVTRTHDLPYRFDWVVVEERDGGMTAFNLDSSQGSGVDPDLHRVVAVMVQREWFSKGRGHGACAPGWERW